MSERINEDWRAGPMGIALWAAVLGAPLIWAIQFETGYALVPKVCTFQGHYVLHIVSLLGLVLALIGGFLSWRQWRRIGGSPDETEGGPIGRRRFLGALGVFSALLYSMLIIAQGIASFFFDACWT